MISDILSDAIADIRKCQDELPENYNAMEAEINAVVSIMKVLRVKLDTPPSALETACQNLLRALDDANDPRRSWKQIKDIEVALDQLT
jgi:hypothetical protein